MKLTADKVMEIFQEEQAVLAAQIALDAALEELKNLQANAKKNESEDANVILMMEMMKTVEVNQAESNVSRAELELENAQNHLMNAQEQKQLLDLIQNLTYGNLCKLLQPNSLEWNKS